MNTCVIYNKILHTRNKRCRLKLFPIILLAFPLQCNHQNILVGKVQDEIIVSFSMTHLVAFGTSRHARIRSRPGLRFEVRVLGGMVRAAFRAMQALENGVARQGFIDHGFIYPSRVAHRQASTNLTTRFVFGAVNECKPVGFNVLFNLLAVYFQLSSNGHKHLGVCVGEGPKDGTKSHWKTTRQLNFRFLVTP